MEEPSLANSDKNKQYERSDNDQVSQKKHQRASERRVVNSIAGWIIVIIVILILTFGVLGYNYVQESLQPLNSRSEERRVGKECRSRW